MFHSASPLLESHINHAPHYSRNSDPFKIPLKLVNRSLEKRKWNSARVNKYLSPYSSLRNTVYSSFTPTNFSNISYLNLEKITHLKSIFLDDIKLSDGEHIRRYMNNLEKYLEYKRFRKPYTDVSVFKQVDNHYEKSHLRHVNEQILNMYEVHVIGQLEHHWDLQKFEKCYNFYARQRKAGMDFRVFPVYRALCCLLVENCRDSEVIVDYFKVLISEETMRETLFLEMEWEGYLKFCLKHANYLRFDVLSHVIQFFQPRRESIYYREILSKEYYRSFVNCLRVPLDYGCPFVLCYLTERFSRVEIFGNWWPREMSTGENVTSGIPCSSSTAFYHSAFFQVHLAVFIYFSLSSYQFHSTQQFSRLNCQPTELKFIYRVMNSVPTPFVTYRDLVDVVEKLEGSYSQNSLTICNLYKDLYPEAYLTNRQPRTLKHLSRCAIRNSCTLPHGIRYLPLPKLLKKYLKLR